MTDRVPDAVVRVIARLERARVSRLDKYYTLGIDYLYWHGALRAMREQRFARSSEPTPAGARPAPRDVERA